MRAPAVVLAVVAMSVVAACSESTGPTPSLQGLWSITGYETDGVVATAVSGTADFASTGTVTFKALITVPGEPQDTVDATATWTQTGSRLVLADSVDTSEWQLTFTANGMRVVLALLNDASASVLTLDRPAQLRLSP